MKNTKYLIVTILAIIAGVLGFFWTKNKISGGKIAEKPPLATNSPSVSPTTKPSPDFPKTVGNFLVTDKEICKKDGKPSIYFFGSTTCPHCVWEKPVMKKVADKFGKEIDYHENIDSQADSEIFSQYSDINPGYIPFLVFGCKYARVGAGETLGKDDAESKKLEEEASTAIICKLTDNKPSSACSSVKNKVSEIK